MKDFLNFVGSIFTTAAVAITISIASLVLLAMVFIATIF